MARINARGNSRETSSNNTLPRRGIQPDYLVSDDAAGAAAGGMHGRIILSLKLHRICGTFAVLSLQCFKDF
jgi:hypothetical protein